MVDPFILPNIEKMFYIYILITLFIKDYGKAYGVRRITSQKKPKQSFIRISVYSIYWDLKLRRQIQKSLDMLLLSFLVVKSNFENSDVHVSE